MTGTDQVNRLWPGIIFILPQAMILGLVSIKIYDPAQYHALIQEDGILENIQFYSYAAAGILCLWAAHDFRGSGLRAHAWLALALGLLLLGVAGEEISWGERLLGYHPPEFIAQYNTQHEMTLHNLKPVQYGLHTMYMLAGLGLSLGWLVKDKLFKRPALRSLADTFVPPWTMTLYFLPVLLVYFFYDWGSACLSALFGPEHFAIGRIIVWRDQESAELLLSLGCLVWAGRLVVQAVHRDQVLGPRSLMAVFSRRIEQP